MNEKQLFRLALGLAAPWYVDSLEFSAEENRLDIHLNFERGSQFPCGVFQDIFTCPAEEGEALLTSWYKWAIRCRMQPIVEFAKTVKRHWEGVVRWFQSHGTNGLLEGMNRLIQAAKARSRGFRNVDNFITMISRIGGKREFQLPNPIPSTHTK